MPGEPWFGLGEEWKEQVGGSDAPKEKRETFYGERTIRKLGEEFLTENASDLPPDEIIAKLKETDILTKDEKIKTASRNRETIATGHTLSAVLHDFFVEQCGSKNPEADAFASLKYLNEDLENTDFVREGESIEINHGQLMIYDPEGTVIARGKLVPEESLPADAKSPMSRRAIVRRESRKKRREVKEDIGISRGVEEKLDIPLPRRVFPLTASLSATAGMSSLDPSSADELSPPGPHPGPELSPPGPPPGPEMSPPRPRTPAELAEFHKRMDQKKIGRLLRPRIIEGMTSPTTLGYGQPKEQFEIIDIERGRKLVIRVPVRASDNPRFKTAAVTDLTGYRDLNVHPEADPKKVDEAITSSRKKEAERLYELGATAKVLQDKLGKDITIDTATGDFVFRGTKPIELLPGRKVKIYVTDTDTTPAINLADDRQARAVFFNENIRETQRKIDIKERKEQILSHDWRGMYLIDIEDDQEYDLLQLSYVAQKVKAPPGYFGILKSNPAIINFWLKEEAIGYDSIDLNQINLTEFLDRVRDLFKTAEEREEEVREVFERLPKDLQPNSSLALFYGTDNPVAQIIIQLENPEKIQLLDAKNRKIGEFESAEELYAVFNEKILYPEVKKIFLKEVPMLQDYSEDDTEALDYLHIKYHPKDKDAVGALSIEKQSPLNVSIFAWKPIFEEPPAPADWKKLETVHGIAPEDLNEKFAKYFPPLNDQLAKRWAEIGANLEELIINIDPELNPNYEFQVLRIFSEDSDKIAGYVKIWKKNPDWLVLEDPEHNRIEKFTDVKKLHEAILKLPRAFLESEEVVVPVRDEIVPKGLDFTKVKSIRAKKAPKAALESETVVVPLPEAEMAKLKPLFDDMRNIEGNRVSLMEIIPKDYEPTGVTVLPADILQDPPEGEKAIQQTIEPLRELHNAMKAALGIDLVVVDGYRTYREQYLLYKQKGADIAANPNHSEHRLGVAFDFRIDGKYTKWLNDNLWKYGFVQTVAHEIHHRRYVGKETAKYMHDHGLTFPQVQKMLFKQDSSLEKVLSKKKKKK